MLKKIFDFKLICRLSGFLALLFSAPLPLCADTGDTRWSFDVGSGMSSPAIGPDGTVYVSAENGDIYAVNPDSGTRKWVFGTDTTLSAPAIDFEGVIYVSAEDGHVYAVRTDGTRKWGVEVGDNPTAPAIGADDCVYVAAGNEIHALERDDGETKTLEDDEDESKEEWSFETDDTVSSSPVIGSDGVVYVGAGESVHAVDAEGNEKWTYSAGGDILFPPSLGKDGVVYVSTAADNKLHAITSGGSRKWVFADMDGNPSSSPIIDSDGTIYFGAEDHHLYALNSGGTLKWKFPVESLPSTPALDSDGNIYVGTADAFYAIDLDKVQIGSDKVVSNPEEAQIWKKEEAAGTLSAPILNDEGTIHIGGKNNRLYAFETGSDGPKKTASWPMFGHDARHTGRNTPRADAGGDQEGLEGDTVTLDGSASVDPNGQTLSYKWERTEGLSATLTDSDEAKASFTVPASSDTDGDSVTFRLTVTNANGLKDTDTCVVTVDSGEGWCFIGTLFGD